MTDSLMTLEELLSGTKGLLISNTKSCEFTSVQTDSRNVVNGTMFVPLVGEFQDGHKYIPQALKNGASVVLLNKSDYEKSKETYQNYFNTYPLVSFIAVENTLHGLQDAAEAYVSKFPSLTKISITGSSGKTTTKEMFVSVFKAKYGDDVVYTQGNFNSETGLPLSVFNIRSNHKIGIFEMGMNRENEIGEISKVLKSKYGIITNIGTAHIGILGSRENIAKEKRKSFDYVPADGAVFVCANDDFADYCTENVKGKVVKFGRNIPEQISGVKFIEDKGLFGTQFSVDGEVINLSLSGEYNYLNALGVIACAKEFGFTAKEIKNGLENISSISGRMETKQVTLKNNKKVILIKDCYNANLDSMTKVIEFCDSLKKIGKKIFVLADMKELGNESKNAHESIGKKINQVMPDYTFLIGPEMKYAYDVLDGVNNSHWYENSNDETFNLISGEINKYAQENDVILLKGSHSMGLEKLIPVLVEEA